MPCNLNMTIFFAIKNALKKNNLFKIETIFLHLTVFYTRSVMFPEQRSAEWWDASKTCWEKQNLAVFNKFYFTFKYNTVSMCKEHVLRLYFDKSVVVVWMHLTHPRSRTRRKSRTREKTPEWSVFRQYSQYRKMIYNYLKKFIQVKSSNLRVLLT